MQKQEKDTPGQTRTENDVGNDVSFSPTYQKFHLFLFSPGEQHIPLLAGLRSPIPNRDGAAVMNVLLDLGDY